jgi:putative membrane protein
MKAFIKAMVLVLAAVPLARPCAGQEKVKPVPDRDFLASASTWAYTGQRFAELAAKMSEDAKLKESAAALSKDYARMDDKVHALAIATSLNLSTGVEPTMRVRLEKLGGLKGEEFNRVYTQAMVEVSENLVRLCEAKAMDADNADLKAYAAKALETLKEQLKQARSASDRFKK